MKKTNYETYIIAMIELLINNNDQTDLGHYVLEYKSDFDEIGGGDMYNGDACFAVAVRLKNKTNDQIEWGNIYYKRLISNSSAFSAESRIKLEKKLSEIYEDSKEKKLEFILRNENKIFKKPYAKNSLVNPELASFFKNLNGSSTYDGYPTVLLGGKFPKDAISYLEAAFNDIVAKTKNISISNKR